MPTESNMIVNEAGRRTQSNMAGEDLELQLNVRNSKDRLKSAQAINRYNDAETRQAFKTTAGNTSVNRGSENASQPGAFEQHLGSIDQKNDSLLFT